jgi:glucose-6-phosphate isomerase
LGVDIRALRDGAQNILRSCLGVSENPALKSAIVLFSQNKAGLNINDNFIFHSELESLGKWCRQLMAESLGKNGKGITPTVSVGSTDLHSMVQLYLGGPKDKITSFIYSGKSDAIKIPDQLSLSGLVENINGRPVSSVIKAILEGTKTAYSKKNLPFIELIIDEINEYELGAFLQFKMVETMFLGQLLEVNAFDQPNVEDYKVETRELLKNS